ncbi:MAG: prolipoprotein diacylglyceryl transferase [Cytophagales bacterium]|nr:prolipoprotein diacylglyceryl transferase [Cytophagales bacterium]
MSVLSYIIWSPDPAIFVIPGLNHPIVWYGLLFALGFIISQQVMMWIFKQDGKPEKHVEKLTVYMVVATIIGARLGHCLFYDPDYYLSNPLAILRIWEGGLASHGGAIGIIFSLYIFSRKMPYSFFWITDRIAIVVCLTGFLIRSGNLMNSEMEGLETKANYGLVYAWHTENFIASDDDVESVDFKRGASTTPNEPGRVPLTAVIEYKEGVKFDLGKQQIIEEQLAQGLNRRREIVQHIDFGGVPLNYRTYDNTEGRAIVEIYGVGTVRHASQMYEAVFYLILMGVLFWLWYKKRDKLPAGFNFCMFLIVLWAGRFSLESFKMNQVDFEEGMALNMGQWLSVPLIFSGIILLVWIYKRKNFKTMSEG